MMKTLAQQSKKIVMWYKIKELSSKGLNKSQISVELGIDRGTVRHYLLMDEQSFHDWVLKPQHRTVKLSEYTNYVKDSLSKHPYISSAQIEDWLKENYSDLPEVHSKTVYNFVKQIRRQYNIPKSDLKTNRELEKLPERDYGLEAQVDFGSFNMITKDKNRQKVHFFVMVLSRSRQKYVYFQTIPFTSKTTVDAHNLAFKYFEGQPKKILYDQDRVLLISENLGDFYLTKEFQTYSSQMSFTPVFCRKADPESKGKIENVVGYVKKNFLKGRAYTDLESLNESALLWLARTANSKKHNGTQLVPHDEWLIEKEYLQPYYAKARVKELRPYKVRKDNTISYKSNFYSLPLGTYQGPDTTVYLNIDDDKVHLYTNENILLTTHDLCNDRGKYIRNTDHRRDKSQSLETLKSEVSNMFANVPSYPLFLEQLLIHKNRFLRDNLNLLKRKGKSIDIAYLEEGFKFCLEYKQFNANTLIQKALLSQREAETKANIKIPSLDTKVSIDNLVNENPSKSSIELYNTIMQ